MRARILLVFLLFALAIAGCGGGEDQETTNGGAPAATEQTEAQGQAAEAEQGSEGEGGSFSGEGVPNPTIATERVPGSKAVAPGVPVTKGGDNSIQAFGAEGEPSEATQALEAFGEYMRARLNGDWQAACDAGSAQFREQLAMLGERAKPRREGVQKPEGCAETLEAIAGSVPTSSLRPVAQVSKLLSFRTREDGYAYLIYEDGEGAVRFIAMAQGDGGWRVNVVEAEEFQGAGGAQ